ncbi:FHA domain-containing protein [Microbacteriaceae bacterium VKM Ac-2854]|nr:FHA domain-containing protein [Microbacteriaceae bacterium VKM Ac-2854]
MICSNCGSALAAGAILCGECGTPVSSQVTGSYSSLGAAGDTTVLDPAQRAWLPGLSTGRHRRAAATADPARAPMSGLMLLSFSTGQHAIVTGSGLIGRQPVPDAGESFRHVLAITDPSRSMSKTHLEFGFDGDGLWVRDRWSSNGTVLVAVGEAELPLEAGKRYRAAAGSLVRLSGVEMSVEKAAR